MTPLNSYWSYIHDDCARNGATNNPYDSWIIHASHLASTCPSRPLLRSRGLMLLDAPAEHEDRDPAWSTTPSAVTYVQQKLPCPHNPYWSPNSPTIHHTRLLPPHICPNRRRPAAAASPSTGAPLRPAQENKQTRFRYDCPKCTLLSFTFANSPFCSTQGAILLLPHNKKHAPPHSSRLQHAARCITMPVNSAMPPEPSHFIEHDIRFP